MIVIFDKDEQPVAESEGIVDAYAALPVLAVEGHEGLHLGVGEVKIDYIGESAELDGLMLRQPVDTVLVQCDGRLCPYGEVFG